MDRLQGASKYTTPDGVTHYAHIPDDFIKILLKMFQTTSVPDFNAIFAGLERDLMVYEGLEDPQLPDTLTVGRILLLAKNTYDTMIGTGDWSNVKTQGTHSGFNVTCWNCDQPGHTVSKCKEPKHKDHIEQKRAEFRKSRSGQGRGRGSGRRGRGSGRGRGPQVPKTGKWAAPSHGEHQRHQIENNGVTSWYKWNSSASRWIKEEPQGARRWKFSDEWWNRVHHHYGCDYSHVYWRQSRLRSTRQRCSRIHQSGSGISGVSSDKALGGS